MVRYKETKRINVTLPRHLYTQVVREADRKTRSLSAQVAHILKLHYEDKASVNPGLPNNAEGKQEVQN